jgi:mRNA interferase MazF
VVKKPLERYGIYLADLDPARGAEIKKTRPVVIVSHAAMNRHLDTVVVCPLTQHLHPGWRSRIRCRCERRDAEIAVDQIRAISKDRVQKRLDRLEPSLESELRALIVEMYGT